MVISELAQPVFHKRARSITFLVMLTFALLGCGPYSPLPWLTASRQDVHVLVPEGFEGKVLIAWQIPDGKLAERERDAWIYRLQEDGALLLQNDPPEQIIHWSFWYARADGSLEPIPSSTCLDSAQDEGIVVCTGMIADRHKGRDLRPNASFIITRLEDYLSGRWGGDEFFRLTTRYLDQLALPAEE